MALNWNISDCNNWETLKEKGEWHKTEYMIFATMSIDMSEITEENAIEFYARLKVVSAAYDGAWYTEGIGWEDPTYEDVIKRIGLNTNASSRNTFKQWFKRIAMVHEKTCSENKLLAAYYSAKAEVEKLIEDEKNHSERNESFAFDLVARSGA
jgi:hypothetical protein